MERGPGRPRPDYLAPNVNNQGLLARVRHLQDRYRQLERAPWPTSGTRLVIEEPEAAIFDLYLLARDPADDTHEYLLKFDGSSWSLIADGVGLLPGSIGPGFAAGGFAAQLGESLWTSFSGLTAAWRSDDVGLTWASKLTETPDISHGIPVAITADGDTLWAARWNGTFYEIVKSIDNGDTWDISLTGITDDLILHAATHLTDSNIIAFAGLSWTGVHYAATIWVTLDGGATWETKVVLDRDEVMFSDSTTLLFTDTDVLLYTTQTFVPASTARLSVYSASAPYTTFARDDLLTESPDQILGGPLMALSHYPQFVGHNWSTDERGRVFRSTGSGWTELAEPFVPGIALKALCYDLTRDALYAMGDDLDAVVLARADNAAEGAAPLTWTDVTADVNAVAGVTLAVLGAQMLFEVEVQS